MQCPKIIYKVYYAHFLQNVAIYANVPDGNSSSHSDAAMLDDALSGTVSAVS